MKSFLLYCLVLLLLCSCCVSAFASDGELIAEEEPSSEPDPQPGLTHESLIAAGYALSDIDVYAINPVTPSGATGLKKVLLNLIGNYDAIIIEYKYRNPNSSYDSYLREVQPDYVWICSFLMFGLVIYWIFKMGSVFLYERR